MKTDVITGVSPVKDMANKVNIKKADETQTSNIQNRMNKVSKIQIRNIKGARLGGVSQSDTMELSVRIFDPSQPNADTQNIMVDQSE